MDQSGEQHSSLLLAYSDGTSHSFVCAMPAGNMRFPSSAAGNPLPTRPATVR